MELRELVDGRVSRTYTQVSPGNLKEEQLAAYAGTYQCEELGVTWRTSLREGHLTLRRPKQADVTLIPAFTDAFTVAGQEPPVVLAFRHNTRGQINGFTVSTSRLRHMPFERVAN